ncbi:hypothetical protein ANN_24260, partial [Periplaneta americana]
HRSIHKEWDGLVFSNDMHNQIHVEYKTTLSYIKLIDDDKNVMFYLTTLATVEVISASPDVPEFYPAGVLLHASKSTDMSLSHLSTLKCHRPGLGSNPQPWAYKASAIQLANQIDDDKKKYLLATAEVISVSPEVPEFCPAEVLLHASKSTDMSLSHLSTFKCHRLGPGSNPLSWT